MRVRALATRAGACIAAVLARWRRGRLRTAAAPEHPSGLDRQGAGHEPAFMVATANPLATRAGYDILRAAATRSMRRSPCNSCSASSSRNRRASAAARSCSITMRARDGSIAYDGRETAPAAAKPDRFLDADGQPLAFLDAVVGGRSVGVPGTVRLLETVHRRHGRLPWPRLFRRAIALAEQRLRDLAAAARAEIAARDALAAAARARLFPDGRRRAAPDRRRVCAIRRTRERCATLAAHGAERVLRRRRSPTTSCARRTTRRATRATSRAPISRTTRQGARAGVRRLSRAIASAACRCRRRAGSPCCRC